MKQLLALTTFLSLLTLYLGGVGDHDLWTPDEPRVAAVGKSATLGAWVAPTLNGTPFLEQPPLHAWCVGLFYRVFGATPEHGPRLLSGLFGIGGLVLTGLLTRRLVGPDRGASAALCSVLCLGVTFEYWATAHRLVVDGALAFFTTGATYSFLLAMEARRAVARWLLTTAGVAGASLAFLTKGAVGLAVPALFCAVTMVRSAPHRRILVPAICAGPVVFALVAGPWLWLIHEELGTEAFRTLFVDNTAGRIFDASEDRSHVRPLYYYIIYFPLHSLPTALALPGALLARWRSGDRLSERGRLTYDVSLLWLGAGLLMLSLASTKRAVYLVPLLPAAAVACGLWVDGLMRDAAAGATSARDRFARLFPYLLAALLAALGAAGPVATYWLEGASTTRTLLGTGCAAGFCLAMLLARRDRLDIALSAWLAGLAATFVVALPTIVPAYDRLKSLGPISRQIGRSVPAGETIYLYDPDETTEALLPLYADRPGTVLRSTSELDEALLRDGRAFVVAVDKTYRRTQRRMEALSAYPSRVLIEDLRPGSRAIRLLLVGYEETGGHGADK